MKDVQWYFNVRTPGGKKKLLGEGSFQLVCCTGSQYFFAGPEQRGHSWGDVDPFDCLKYTLFNGANLQGVQVYIT